ncbi:hypothetical protein JVT61DRAFT_7604 [Boletus reticuloceps]|uniref:Ornithine cyclodeaminase n=1 Tax=Boletus reticuloceps TaxID=495285 RepID=A0A8I3A6Z7_9AGAM|nr:hypothetical protein JVT61DRAFT_7604 [Boletus reticuloceps]
MQSIVTGLCAPSFDFDAALRLYDRLNELPTPRFAESRMTLPCIAFPLPSLSPSRIGSTRVYHADTFAFGRVEIRSRHNLSQMNSLYLVHPWLDTLLQHGNMHSGAFVGDDGEIFDEDTDDEESDDDSRSLTLEYTHSIGCSMDNLFVVDVHTIIIPDPDTISTAGFQIYDMRPTYLPPEILKAPTTFPSPAYAVYIVRTAAGSVLATRLLISKVPKTLIAFGAGKQIKAHVDLHLRAFPSFESCTIVNRTGMDGTRLYELASSLRQSHPSIAFNTIKLDDRDRVKDAVSKADVICTATSSEEPLFPSEWVSPGTHLNLVGSFTPQCEEGQRATT